MKKKLIAIYTDKDFPLDERNLFASSGRYESIEDWNENSGMEEMKVLALVDGRAFRHDFDINNLLPYLKGNKSEIYSTGEKVEK